MVSCLETQAPVLLTFHDSPKRKLKYSWQAIELADGWVGINTSLANALVREGIEKTVVSELSGFEVIRPEQKMGKSSRVDLVLGRGSDKCFVEVKNVTLYLGEGNVAFPDAVTTRGTKHLKELTQVVQGGGRAALVYCVQRESAQRVYPAWDRDPVYSQTLLEAQESGVEIYAYRAAIDHSGVQLTTKLPVILDPD